MFTHEYVIRITFPYERIECFTYILNSKITLNILYLFVLFLFNILSYRSWRYHGNERGNAQKFHIFDDANAILRIIAVPDGAADSVLYDITAEVILFAEDETTDSIDRWLNNQYSDAIFVDTALPEQVIALTSAEFNVTASTLLEVIDDAADGKTYHKYQLEYALTATEHEQFNLSAFAEQLHLFVNH